MSLRNQIRNAGFPTELVSFRNTKQGTLCSFPAFGQGQGWYTDVPWQDAISTMEWSWSFRDSE